METNPGVTAQDQIPTQAMVPYEDPAPESPSKRARGTLALPEGLTAEGLVGLIQSTISSSIQGNLGHIEQSLTNLSNQASGLNTRLADVETGLQQRRDVVQDMKTDHDRHICKLQGDIVELQKVVTSARGSPVGSREASGSPSSFRAVPPFNANEDAQFGIIVGGWPEGKTRDWVEHQVAKLIDNASLSSELQDVQIYGKRPNFARITPKFSAEQSFGSMREAQVRFRDKLRAVGWQIDGKTAWVTLDKSPKMRQISKAVAKLSSFLTTCYGTPRDLVAVASWQYAKAFVGDQRITGLSPEAPGGTKPVCNSSELRWLV